MLAATTAACTDRGSDLAVVYRGDVAAYRPLVHVQLDTGSRARVVTPAFPSSASPTEVASRGELPVVVAFITSSGDTAARYTVPPLALAPRTSYQVGIVIGRRPAASRCNGAWLGTPVTRRLAASADSTVAADSMFVSVTVNRRAKEPPRCDE
jgi:hypothetical protein